MIEIRYLQAESGANKFGTCNCCGKSSSEDPLMISIKFSYYGHGTLICLCDDCRKKLMEALPSAQPEIIRCRNCKFASGDSRICMKFGHSPIGELDFCAWAERRTDG